MIERRSRHQRSSSESRRYSRPRGSLISSGNHLRLPPEDHASVFTVLPTRPPVPCAPFAAGQAPVRPHRRVCTALASNPGPRMNPASARRVIRFSATTFPPHPPSRREIRTRPSLYRLLPSPSPLASLQGWKWQCQCRPSRGRGRIGADHPLTFFEECQGFRKGRSTATPPH